MHRLPGGEGAGGLGGRGRAPGAGRRPALTRPVPPSITPPASTVNAACPASTGPRTTPSTLPTLAAVSGVGPGGATGCPEAPASRAPGALARLWEAPPGSHAPALSWGPGLGVSRLPGPCPGCNCESDFTDGTCEDLTGRCYCRPNFTGERCDACAEGFTGFPHCYREGVGLGGPGGESGGAFGPADACCLLPQRCPPSPPTTPGSRCCRPDRS